MDSESGDGLIGVRLVVPLERRRILHQLIQGQGTLAQPAEKLADQGQAAGELLDIAQPSRLAHALDGLDLLRVCLNAALRDKEAE